MLRRWRGSWGRWLLARAGLTPAIVVAEAARLADEVGYEAVTLAALASRFDVAVPSLYKHIAGIDDVRRRVAIRSVQELGEMLVGALSDALAKAPPYRADHHGVGAHEDGTGDDAGWVALRAVADAFRGYARAHPGRYAATVRAPAPEDVEHRRATDEVLATVLGLLARYGLEGDEAIDAARAVRSALHGFIVLEAAGGFGLPRDVGRSYTSLVDGLHVALRAWRTR